MIDKRKPFKKCPACQKRKGKDHFPVRKVINKSGENVLYSNSYCIPCQRGNVMGYYSRKLKGRKKTRRRCFCCYKYKPLKEFKKTLRHGVRSYHGNCIDCEDTLNLDLTRYHEGSRREHDTINSRHYIAFIGNASYKDICKVFKIKYEKN